MTKVGELHTERHVNSIEFRIKVSSSSVDELDFDLSVLP